MITQVELSEELCAYVRDVSLRDTPLFREMRATTARMPLASMQVSAEEGQFLGTFIRAIGASRALEIGVFTGYSLVTTALSLPADGHVVACEINPEWAAVAKEYCMRAGVSHKVDLLLGDARALLRQMLTEGMEASFDFAFIDADKVSYEEYYELTLKLLRTGGSMIFDNVLWSGLVADEATDDADARALRAFNEMLHEDGRIHLSMLPFADGLTLAVKR